MGSGILASRTLTMIKQYFDGRVPDLGTVEGGTELQSWTEGAIHRARVWYESFAFQLAIGEIGVLAGKVDEYLSVSKPWAISADASRLKDLQCVLYHAAEALRIVVVLAHPVIPEATQKIWEQLGQQDDLAKVRIDKLEWGGLVPGTKIGKLESVFPRADKKEAMERIEAMENEIRNPGSTPASPAPSIPATTGASASAAPAAAPAETAKIGIEDFAKVELRVGLVKSAERIQGADKLLKLMVDIGDEIRQVLAGIALGYAPEDLVGRKVVVVTNLAPRKMRGLESNGMLLAASAGADGKPVLCTFAEDIPVGSKVK